MSYDVRVYSLKNEGNVYVTPHFRVREFACNDGSDVVIINLALPQLLEKVRSHFGGVSVTLNSGYRTVAYNARVSGSSSESQHCNGNAADIVVKGVKPRDVARYIETLIPSSGGIGVYTTFTHVDVRKTKARW